MDSFQKCFIRLEYQGKGLNLSGYATSKQGMKTADDMTPKQ